MRVSPEMNHLLLYACICIHVSITVIYPPTHEGHFSNRRPGLINGKNRYDILMINASLRLYILAHRSATRNS